MSDHFIVVDDTEANHYTIECAEPSKCQGWWECLEDHDGYDPEDEQSPAFDEFEDVEIHGAFHEYRHGYGWTVPYPGCVVADYASIEPPDGLWDREAKRWRSGRWLLDVDWDDMGLCLTLVDESGAGK